MLATTILANVLCLILVALRFATRIWIVKKVGWDDWCILFACVRNESISHCTYKFFIRRQCRSRGLARSSRRLRPGDRTDCVRFRQTSLLLDRASIPRIPQIRVRRKASGLVFFPHCQKAGERLTLESVYEKDICYSDVHQSLYMSFLATDHRYQ